MVGRICFILNINKNFMATSDDLIPKICSSNFINFGFSKALFLDMREVADIYLRHIKLLT